MELNNVLSTVREKAASFDSNNYNGFLAVQVTLTDIENGVFYAEIKDQKLSIEPYEYNDRQANLITTSEVFIKIINGKLDPVLAFTTGKLKVDGDAGKVLELAGLLK